MPIVKYRIPGGRSSEKRVAHVLSEMRDIPDALALQPAVASRAGVAKPDQNKNPCRR
jgi:hypothetical protein